MSHKKWVFMSKLNIAMKKYYLLSVTNYDLFVKGMRPHLGLLNVPLCEKMPPPKILKKCGPASVQITYRSSNVLE